MDAAKTDAMLVFNVPLLDIVRKAETTSLPFTSSCRPKMCTTSKATSLYGYGGISAQEAAVPITPDGAIASNKRAKRLP